MRRVFLLLPVIALGIASLAAGQAGTSGGIIEGTVRDAQGLVMPGTTVTLSGAAVMGEPVANTFEDGTFRFRALRPGTYNVRFELPGFQTFNREGIIVEGNRTVTINVTLDVATVAETITVTGESPVVDVRNTALSTEFSTTELQDVPSATDVWAVLGQTPGVRMRGYDVGGSHKSQQSGYESFGVRGQNRVLSEGVDSTEGTSGTGFYYDYYSIEEFTASAAGSDVEMSTPGSMIVMTVKGGGNEFSGLYHADYEGESFVGNNIDDDLAQRGYTGNPNLLFYELHADLGGPIVKDRFWFYGFYTYFKIDKQVSGVDPSVATDLAFMHNLGFKLTFKATDKDSFVWYSNFNNKQKPLRGLSVTQPAESILAQDGWAKIHKGEWQRIWSDRAFTTFAFKRWGFTWPMVPAVDPQTHPARIDTATNIRSGAGWIPFYFIRDKPQVTASLNYYLPNKAGSHDFKFGLDWQVNISKNAANSTSGIFWYRDNSNLGRPQNVDEIRLYNMPESGITPSDDRNQHTDFFVQDTWTVNDRLTLMLGLRFGRQDLYYLPTETNPALSDFFPTGTFPGKDLVTQNNLAPRIGVTYDLTGDGKTVLKGYYGRYYLNFGTIGAANPAGESWLEYKFLDQNQNGLYDGPHELGNQTGQSGVIGSLEEAEGTEVNPNMDKGYADEFNVSVEREIAANTGVRFSWVRKQMRNQFGTWNIAQGATLLSNPIPCGDGVWACPENALTGQPITTLARVPDAAANEYNNVYTTYPGTLGDDDFDTLQFAFNRRFNQDFFAQASFDYQWRDERRQASSNSGSPLTVDPIGVGYYQNHNQAGIDSHQKNTNFNFRFLTRYQLPHEFAVSGNLRYQNGWPWAAIQRVTIPGSGTQAFFLEDINNNRSDNVMIVDLRVEKMFLISERARVTAMFDLYNTFNGNPVSNFQMRTGSSFGQIIAVLDPRTFKIGIRFQF